MDVESSAVDYRYSDAVPAMACGELISVTDFDHSVINAIMVPSSPDRSGIM